MFNSNKNSTTVSDKPKVGSTQEHLPIKTIHDNLVILKNGCAALILQTSAVNFDLLSENEQLAIISSFAQLLNSLNFSIQIVIRSKRLDISQYVNSLKAVEEKQTNPLLKQMTQKYIAFVENLTSENQVLDKQFYVVISVSSLELGLVSDIEKDLQKAMDILLPRRDHIINQLSRIGLKATQLDNEKLLRLFFDIYNESFQDQDIRAFIDNKIAHEQPQPTVPKADPNLNQPKPQPVPAPIVTPPLAQPAPPVINTPPPAPIPQEPTPQLPPSVPPFNFTDIQLNARQAHPEEYRQTDNSNPFINPFIPDLNNKNIIDQVNTDIDESHPQRPTTAFNEDEVDKLKINI